MNIKAITYKLLAAVAIWAITACADEKPATTESIQGIEMSGIAARMSRAGELEVADLKDYVGKKEFDNDDRAVFTTIKRTANAIDQFNYSNLEFICAASTSAAGVTSIGWSRNKEKGTTAATGDAHPDRIYWSDATNPHTFTGFCTPQQGGGKAFDWEEDNGAYYGSIGDPTLTGGVNDTIDYRSTFDGAGNETLSGNVELRKNDILLTHSTEVKAQDAIAKLYFYHGLAQVRVIVNISDFAASGGADTLSRVSDMVLKDMLTMYKWSKNSVETQNLVADDQKALDALYSSPGVPSYNQKKSFKLWIPQPNGVGYKSSRTFTFYGMVVPTVIPEYDPGHPEKALSFSFKVKYPDPMNPTNMKTHTYNASIGGIRFDSGKCTTISISLNHKNEKITVGAEYDDWEFIATPDQGALKKNSTFLTSTARNNVTIIGDPNATVDDATWLYINSEGKIVDIYDNDGSAEHPFQISTADQLLSFAYEVKGTNRTSNTTSKTYKGLDNADHALDAGFDFTGYYVTLDADITMQKSLEIKHDGSGFYTINSEGNRVESTEGVTWPGIGDASHQFNGVFNGGYRHINRLYGEPFFGTIGADGKLGHIFISDALGITGKGSIAEVNNGVICGAYIEGDVEAINDGPLAGSYCGSIVGENHSMLISCSHIGNIKGTNYETVGALLGYNDGIVAICYNCGNVTSTGSGEHTYAGIGTYTPRSIAYSCYFNSDLYSGHDHGSLNTRIGHVAFPLPTAMMQSSTFVNKVAEVDTEGRTIGGEIINDGIAGKTNPFFFHLSLNAGIERAVAMLRVAVQQEADVNGDIIIHNVTAGEPNPFEVLKLKKTLVQWLIDHYSYQAPDDVDDMDMYEITHRFQFIPGTYPKLK